MGIAGCHVDGFILGGDRSSNVFVAAKLALQQAFEWGKWEESAFEFAGCNIVQKEDGTIFMDQKVYTDRWMEEIPLTPQCASGCATNVRNYPPHPPKPGNRQVETRRTPKKQPGLLEAQSPET